jgi:hypothetical protein
MEPLTIQCIERGVPVDHTITPLYMTTQSIQKLYDKMSQFPVIFGKPLGGVKDFLNIFMSYSRPSGDPSFNGMFWAIDDLETGVFYMTDINPFEATVHFAFFDKKLNGREELVKAMLGYGFEFFRFQRLNAEIPKYIKGGVHLFIQRCGLSVEGIKRSASFYKGQWFDLVSYGILKSEVTLPAEAEPYKEIEHGSENN